jgi:hypothetical protein
MVNESHHAHPLLPEFDDADVGSLICPRPFGIEAGIGDDAVDRSRAEVEFERLHAIYEKLGLADRCRMFKHDGGHEVEDGETPALQFVQFLDTYLR